MSTQTVAPTTPEALLAIIVDNKKVEQYKAESSPYLKAAQGFTIDDETDYEYSLTIAEDAIRRRKQKVDWIAPAKKLTDMLHSLLCAMERQMIADDIEIERLIKERRKEWRQEKDRIQAEKDRRDREAAREAEQNRLLAEAAQLEKEGEKEAAEVVVEQAMNVSAPVSFTRSAVPKQEGSSVRKKWGYRIVRPDQVQRAYCSPDPKLIKPVVDSLGDKAPVLGLEIFPDETEAITTKGR